MFYSARNSLLSFRATDITDFLENDGTLEAAQRIALFPAALGKTGKLSCRPLMRTDVGDGSELAPCLRFFGKNSE
jgi:hypothetical protein